MKIYGYIRISGKEYIIKHFESCLLIEGSCIKHLTKVVGKYSVTGEDSPWVWKTAPKKISHQKFDEDLQEILTPFSQQFLQTKNTIRAAAFVELQLVVEYEEGDSPIGMSFSNLSIKSLSEIGAALDIDAISYLD